MDESYTIMEDHGILCSQGSHGFFCIAIFRAADDNEGYVDLGKPDEQVIY